MPSTEHGRVDPRLFAGALLASSGLQLVELLLPRIPVVPWLRPGFSWIVILPFLLDFGTLPALALFLGRNLLAMAFGGQPASTFLISSTSGALAILACGPLLRALTAQSWIARAGASIALAAAFNSLQLLLVAEVLVGSTGYFLQIGPLLLWSVFSGLLVAWLSLPLGNGRGWKTIATLAPATKGRDLSNGSVLQSVAAGAFMASSLILHDHRALLALLLVSIAWGRRAALRSVWQTWPFLPYLAWFHLRGTPGELVAGGWITREGVGRFVEHGLRLWCFTAYGRILTERLPWSRLLRLDSPWTRGFSLALPRMPSIFPAALGAGRDWWREGRSSGLPGLLKRFGDRLG